MKTFRYLVALVTILLASIAGPAMACPKVAGNYLDTDCDGKLRVLTLGDSITFGRRDEGTLNIAGNVINFSDFGGYPIRLQKYLENFPEIEIIQKAKPGSDCTHTLTRLKSFVRSKEGRFIDLAFVDCGINDFYTTHDSDLTKKIIFNIRTFAKRSGIKAYVANLIPVGVEYQQTWQETLNRKVGSLANIDFSKMPADLLSYDGIHPAPEGHQFLFEIIKDYFESTFGSAGQHTSILKSVGLTQDTDADGLPNKVEKMKYKTDPKVADTDADGFTDFEEAQAGTNPLNELSF